MVLGHRFDLLPDNALGIMARSNDDPTEKKDSVEDTYLFDITEKTEKRMVFVAREQTAHVPNYLGCIVTQDVPRTLLWVNDTKPLP